MISVILPNANEPLVEEVIQRLEIIPEVAQVIVAVDRYKKGKGYAVREALVHTKHNDIAIIDADMDIAPRMFNRLIPFLIDYDVVVGTKKLTNAPFHRKVITHLSRIYTRIVFGLHIDTQTGIKLFRRSAIEGWKTDGWAFDIEMLLRAKKNKQRMIELPVEACITARVSWKALWITLLETIKIRFSV